MWSGTRRMSPHLPGHAAALPLLDGHRDAETSQVPSSAEGPLASEIHTQALQVWGPSLSTAPFECPLFLLHCSHPKGVPGSCGVGSGPPNAVPAGTTARHALIRWPMASEAQSSQRGGRRLPVSWGWGRGAERSRCWGPSTSRFLSLAGAFGHCQSCFLLLEVLSHLVSKRPGS